MPLRTAGVSAVNNAINDPLQGFDADVWVIDQGTGNHILVGRFTSMQITIRNATEPYLEFNQRIPRYLDGEIQIGWVLERGLLDSRILEQTFGYSQMTRELRLSRGVRFQITFEMNAPELESGASTVQPSSIGNGELKFDQTGRPTGGDSGESYGFRKSHGQNILTFCKVDSFTMGAMAGRSVIANRWEGLAEGIQYVDRRNVWAGQTLGNAKAAGGALFECLSALDSTGRIDPAGINAPRASGPNSPF